MGSDDSGRREPRTLARIRVVLLIGSRELHVLTEDISAQGMRLRTDLSLPPRQLVRLRLPIGEGEAELACQGMVVHAHPSEADGTPTLGVQFYALDGAVRDAWSRLLHARRAPEALPAVEPVRRGSPRRPARVTVYVATVDDLVAFTTVNVSRGGMFLATTQPLPVGASVRLEIKNAETNPFAIDAVVRRVELDRDPPGMAVEFLEEVAPSRYLAPDDDEDAPVFVTSFDPDLA